MEQKHVSCGSLSPIYQIWYLILLSDGQEIEDTYFASNNQPVLMLVHQHDVSACLQFSAYLVLCLATFQVLLHNHNSFEICFS